jgi:hypothetical protein
MSRTKIPVAPVKSSEPKLPKQPAPQPTTPLDTPAV